MKDCRYEGDAGADGEGWREGKADERTQVARERTGKHGVERSHDG